MRTLLIAAAAALSAGAVLARQPAPPPVAPPIPAHIQAGVSDAELAAMRAVSRQVRQVTLQHQQQIAAEPNEEARGELQRALFAQLDAIVRARGLTVERYNQIATMAASNADLARAIGPS